jgi:hypothetical protein
MLAKRHRRLVAIVGGPLVTSIVACGSDQPRTTGPTPNSTTLRMVFRGSTTRRTDLPASAAACVNGVGTTHAHPSWRNFATVPLTPIPPDRYEMTFDDVPIGERVSFRVNDQNSCDKNPTGAVTQNVSVNDVTLVQNTTTPGNGDEPGFAFTLSASGGVSQ